MILCTCNDDTASLCVNEFWGRISRKPIDIEAQVQTTTKKKWPIACNAKVYSLQRSNCNKFMPT